MSRLRPADALAGLGGVVLLGSLFLHWYRFDAGGLAPGTATRAVVAPLTGWQAFSVIDILLAAVAALAIALALVTAVARGPAKPVALTVLTSVFAPAAVALVAFRLLDAPGDDALIALQAGAWVGLAGALLTTAGGWLALADERTPGAVAPRVPRRPAPRPGGLESN